MFLKKIKRQYRILAMAYNRDRWVDLMRSRLNGAFDEYVCDQYAKVLSYDHSWDAEIARLFKKISELFDPGKVKTKSRFNRHRAFQEAYQDFVHTCTIVTGKNKILDKAGPDFLVWAKKLKAVDVSWDEEQLAKAMLKKYAPDLFDLIK